MSPEIVRRALKALGPIEFSLEYLTGGSQKDIADAILLAITELSYCEDNLQAIVLAQDLFLRNKVNLPDKSYKYKLQIEEINKLLTHRCVYLRPLAGRFSTTDPIVKTKSYINLYNDLLKKNQNLEGSFLDWI